MPGFPIFTTLAATLALAAASHATDPRLLIVNGMDTQLLAVSRDGNTLAASDYWINSSNPGLFFAPLQVWRRGGGPPFGISSLSITLPRAVSADGSSIAGLNLFPGARDAIEHIAFSCLAVADAPPESVRRLPPPTGTHPHGTWDFVSWLSPNGDVGVGSCDGILTRWDGLRGTAAPSATYLHMDGSSSVQPEAVPFEDRTYSALATDDLSMVVGINYLSWPFTWTPTIGHGYQLLPTDPTWSWVDDLCMTPDGHAVVAIASITDSFPRLVQWSIDPVTHAGTLQTLADASLWTGVGETPWIRPPTSISSDGGIIVFHLHRSGEPPQPMLRLSSGPLGQPDITGVGRVISFADYLTAHGVSLSTVDESADGRLAIADIISVSGDGRTFCGNGTIQAEDPDLGTFNKHVVWTIRLSVPACNPADLAGLGGSPAPDGQLTADDVVIYLTAFFAGDLVKADLAHLGGAPGPDGQITPDDLIAFLTAFFAGCS